MKVKTIVAGAAALLAVFLLTRTAGAAPVIPDDPGEPLPDPPKPELPPEPEQPAPDVPAPNAKELRLGKISILSVNNIPFVEVGQKTFEVWTTEEILEYLLPYTPEARRGWYCDEGYCTRWVKSTISLPYAKLERPAFEGKLGGIVVTWRNDALYNPVDQISGLWLSNYNCLDAQSLVRPTEPAALMYYDFYSPRSPAIGSLQVADIKYSNVAGYRLPKPVSPNVYVSVGFFRGIYGQPGSGAISGGDQFALTNVVT